MMLIKQGWNDVEIAWCELKAAAQQVQWLFQKNCLLNNQMSCLMLIVDSLSKKSEYDDSMLSSGVSGTLKCAQNLHEQGIQKLQATIPSEVVMPGVMPESNQTDNNLLSTQPEPLSTDAEPFDSTMESVWANLENTTFFSSKWWHQVAASTMSDGSASKNDTIATDNTFEVLQNSSKTRWIPSQEKKLSLSRHAIEVSKTQQAFGCSHCS